MPPSVPSHGWKYFTRSNDKKTAKCNLCNKEYAYTGGSTNLSNHLKMKHSVATEVSAVVTQQPSVTSFLTSPAKKVSDEKITQAIADMILTDYVPLSIVEGDGFRRLLEVLAPNYKIPCRSTVRSRILQRYDSEKETLRSDLAKMSSASITTDTWTSNSTESFITVTEHHITINGRWNRMCS